MANQTMPDDELNKLKELNAYLQARVNEYKDLVVDQRKKIEASTSTNYSLRFCIHHEILHSNSRTLGVTTNILTDGTKCLVNSLAVDEVCEYVVGIKNDAHEIRDFAEKTNMI